jgi:PAS domain S-box-containing protein
MKESEFQLQGVSDPRLAVHATSALPAWLWSADGSRVLWCNPVGARLFGTPNAAALAKKTFGPADAHRRQIAQLTGRLPPTGAIRLDRLRGFGAPPGMLMTCACARFDFPDGSHGILVAAAEMSGRTMPLVERLQRLVDGVEMPMAAFTRDGMLINASEPARRLLGFRNLSEAGLDAARSDALTNGRVEMPIDIGHLVLQRVGDGPDIGLVALIAPGATRVAPRPEPVSAQEDQPMPDYEQPAQSGEAPAEYALIGEVAKKDGPQEPDTKTDADEVASETTSTEIAAVPPAPVPSAEAPSAPDGPGANGRRHPLRFAWQMDAEGHFSLGSDEFTRLIGPRTAAGFGRPWHDIAEAFGLDPSGRVLDAIATRDTWSGLTIYWPVDGGGRLPVELSGQPIHDQERNFTGYRGIGVCRDLDSLAHLAELRRLEPSGDWPAAEPPPADIVPADSWRAPAADSPAKAAVLPFPPHGTPASPADETSPQTDLDAPVETPKESSKESSQNVVPFRPVGETKSPILTPVENSAFNELARRLSARLDRDDDGATTTPATLGTTAAPPADPPDWLAPPDPPARGETRRDRTLLDLLPTGILIYRLDRLLYANPAFLERIGYDSLYALAEAGGLDALYVEPGVSASSSTSEAGTPMRISTSQDASEANPSIEARLFTISWDGDSALALMFSPTEASSSPEAAAAAAQEANHDETAHEDPAFEKLAREPAPIGAPPAAGQANGEDFAAILDTTAEGIVMFDAEGNVHACNRSAEALFGYDGDEFVRHNLTDLFAPESQRAVLEYLESVKGDGVASLLDHGRDVLGRVVKGGIASGIIPLSMTMGRTRPDGPNFFAVFRDLSQGKKGDGELQQARRQADRAANAKADMLARISHEIRTPLNAIMGFAEMMMGESFGALGNERYAEYMKDIRASGERVIDIINDLTELSRIETGKLELAFASQNLNELVESCVTVMQPQANRERIIIRTSLAQALPPVVADGSALRQITLNLIGTSIHLANPAGQVIVSTALSDFGEVVLRVRDTGHGLNDNEVAAALEPFRAAAPSDQTAEGSGVNLSLTKALVEANRAQFHIKTGGRSGTLIEVVFPHAMARA